MIKQPIYAALSSITLLIHFLLRWCDVQIFPFFVFFIVWRLIALLGKHSFKLCKRHSQKWRFVISKVSFNIIHRTDLTAKYHMRIIILWFDESIAVTWINVTGTVLKHIISMWFANGFFWQWHNCKTAYSAQCVMLTRYVCVCIPWKNERAENSLICSLNGCFLVPPKISISFLLFSLHFYVSIFVSFFLLFSFSSFCCSFFCNSQTKKCETAHGFARVVYLSVSVKMMSACISCW